MSNVIIKKQLFAAKFAAISGTALSGAELPDFNSTKFTLGEFLEIFGLAASDPRCESLASLADMQMKLAIRRACFPNNQLLSVTQCLKCLGIGRTNFYALIGKGQFIAVKIGRRTYVRTSDLAEYLRNLPTFQSSAHPLKGPAQ